MMRVELEAEICAGYGSLHFTSDLGERPVQRSRDSPLSTANSSRSLSPLPALGQLLLFECNLPSRLTGFSSLTALVGWSFGSAVAYLLGKRMVSQSVRVSTVQTWINLSTLKRDRITFVNWSARGILITTLATATLSLTTSGFSAILTCEHSFATREIRKASQLSV